MDSGNPFGRYFIASVVGSRLAGGFSINALKFQMKMCHTLDLRCLVLIDGQIFDPGWVAVRFTSVLLVLPIHQSSASWATAACCTAYLDEVEIVVCGFQLIGPNPHALFEYVLIALFVFNRLLITKGAINSHHYPR